MSKKHPKRSRLKTRTKHYILPPNHENMLIAQEVRIWVRAQIHHSATYPRNNMFHDSRRASIFKAVQDIRELSKCAQTMIDNPSCRKRTLYYYALAMVDTIVKYSLGNCFEYAFLGIFYIAMRYPDTLGELIAIKNGDHALIVIGRDPKSDQNNPHTWGKKAVICDPWSNTYYSADQYEIKTSAFHCRFLTTPFGEVLDNHTTQFNSKTQSVYISSVPNSRRITQSAVNEEMSSIPKKSYLPDFFYPSLEKKTSMAREAIKTLLGLFITAFDIDNPLNFLFLKHFLSTMIPGAGKDDIDIMSHHLRY